MRTDRNSIMVNLANSLGKFLKVEECQENIGRRTENI